MFYLIILGAVVVLWLASELVKKHEEYSMERIRLEDRKFTKKLAALDKAWYKSEVPSTGYAIAIFGVICFFVLSLDRPANTDPLADCDCPCEVISAP